MRVALYISILALTVASCKKEGCTDSTALNYNAKAKKDDGSCTYATTPTYTVPSTYVFTHSSGNSTVSYSGQTNRINQLLELSAYANSGESTIISAQAMKDMFANVGGNGNGNFTFTATQQLKDKCFSLDTALISSYFDRQATASQSFAVPASNGQAGTLTSGTSVYLFDANGFDNAELIEKSIMGAVFMYQALNVYFGPGKIDLDNTTAVDPTTGKYYTLMEHSWDEAFGYFGVPIDFPTTTNDYFWSEYSVKQDLTLNCNSIMSSNFRKGRAAISNKVIADRDASIVAIREMWENIAAYQAMTYLDEAMANFGSNQGAYLHKLSEAYAFVNALRYAPLETRNLSSQQVDAILAAFGTNLWNLSLSDIQSIKNSVDNAY